MVSVIVCASIINFLFQSRWMQGTTEKNAAEYASIEAVSVEAEKCKESQLQVMYHREFVPADGHEGLLKQARALQSITKTQQEQLAFARKLSGELKKLISADNGEDSFLKAIDELQ